MQDTSYFTNPNVRYAFDDAVTFEKACLKLRDRGHQVTPAEGPVPGLYDAAGIGRDLTTNQVLDVARKI